MAEQLDWGPLYMRHRDAMYRVARATLHDRGLSSLADDAVNEAIVSLMGNPPQNVRNWEAVLVSTAKRRALDIIRSAAVKHDVGLMEAVDSPESTDDQMAEHLDLVAAVRQVVSTLGQREQHVVAEYLLKDRDRASVAQELGVTAPRVSQIASSIQAQVRKMVAKGEGER